MTMNKHAVFHQPKSNYCYVYKGNTVHIRIRAAKGDLDDVTLIYGDKYDWQNNRHIKMVLECSDGLYDYFTTAIEAPNRRLSYFFMLHNDDAAYYFTEWGVLDAIDEAEVHLHFFNYPFVNGIDRHDVPEWAKDAVFYQIFPERFYNGNKDNDPTPLQPWGEKPERTSFFGGDLQGIIEKLDYLSDLGVNAIYLTPVFQSTTNHKYNTTDYMKIDPNFGDLETMKNLVEACHKRGIKVLFDAVFNHSGYDFAPFQDVVKKGQDSKYVDWFHINKLPIEIDPLSYDAFAFEPKMPKLNTENPQVIDYLLKVATYWIEEVDIDGWRLDVANEVDHQFWRVFRKAVKKVKKDTYIVGEIWHDSLPWLMGDQFDAIMNYPFTRACMQYFAYGQVGHKAFKEMINNTLMRNTQQVNEVMFNLLDSHDTSRFLTKSEGNVDKLKMAVAFQLTYIGTPCIYYGTEIGMEGGEDPDCRRTMEWNPSKWDMGLYHFYQKLINIRKNHRALRRGNFEWVQGIGDVVAFRRTEGNEEVLVVINNNEENHYIAFDGANRSSVRDVIDNTEIDPSSGKIMMPIEKYSVKIIASTY